MLHSDKAITIATIMIIWLNILFTDSYDDCEEYNLTTTAELSDEERESQRRSTKNKRDSAAVYSGECIALKC